MTPCYVNWCSHAHDDAGNHIAPALLKHLEVFTDAVSTPSERDDEMSDEPREGDTMAVLEPSHKPTRREMLEALLMREDLLPSNGWPWTTKQLHDAYQALLAERADV